MKILALEHELSTATAEQFQQYTVAEARKVWDFTQMGVLREIYFRADRNEAVLVRTLSRIGWIHTSAA